MGCMNLRGPINQIPLHGVTSCLFVPFSMPLGTCPFDNGTDAFIWEKERGRDGQEKTSSCVEVKVKKIKIPSGSPVDKHSSIILFFAHHRFEIWPGILKISYWHTYRWWIWYVKNLQSESNIVRRYRYPMKIAISRFIPLFHRPSKQTKLKQNI